MGGTYFQVVGGGGGEEGFESNFCLMRGEYDLGLGYLFINFNVVR